MAADDSETLATSWPVAMNMAVIPFGLWSPLLLAPERTDPIPAATPQWYASPFGSTRMTSRSTSPETLHSAVTRLPRVFMVLTIDAFLSVAKLDSR